MRPVGVLTLKCWYISIGVGMLSITIGHNNRASHFQTPIPVNLTQ